MRRAPPPTSPKPLRTIDLARAAGVSIETIRRLERRGLLRCVRDYRGWRAFPPTEVARLRALLGWSVLELLEMERPAEETREP
jgi:DNA-binding transcriptional MerR regulator